MLSVTDFADEVVVEDDDGIRRVRRPGGCLIGVGTVVLVERRGVFGTVTAGRGHDGARAGQFRQVFSGGASRCPLLMQLINAHGGSL
jgi:hypothetical protein